MKRKILIALALTISVITGAQTTVKPANLNGAVKCISITFTAKRDFIEASYSISECQQQLDWISFKFSGTTRSQIMLEDAWICSIVNKATAMSTTLQSASKDKFAIPNNLPPGTYNFLLNDKVVATNYRVQ